MAVQYNVDLEFINQEISVKRTFNNKSDSDTVTEEISKIQERYQHFSWNEPGLSEEIGRILLNILNGDNQLEDALKEADAHGEHLQVFIRKKGEVPDLPFELLYKSQFLAPSKMHIIRQVSDYGHKKEVHPESRPLKVLFMACSPQDVSPVLDFEKEEEIILDVTKNLPIDIYVEDTGSLQGLYECLEQNEYDIIHLTGHANIEEGIPYLCMEDEEGFLEKVTPSHLKEILSESLKQPRLIFLSGCKTGEAPNAAVSFAHELVVQHSPTVVGWGLPVTDSGATLAATRIYRELSRGKSIIDAVFSARQVLFNNAFSDWSLLRLFSDGTPLDIPLVEKGQKKKVKARDIQYAYLLNSQVKVLEKGFVGRRRQIQRGISCLRKDRQKVGLFLHGTGGLGKSCLAGKFCERFKDHVLMIVKGKLNAMAFFEAIECGLVRAKDEEGLQILQAKEEIPKKIMQLCLSSFLNNKYLILLDDFEENLKGVQEGAPIVSDEAAPILGMLLRTLPLVCKSTQLIITSRYIFPLVNDGRDFVSERLECIGLTSFRGADEKKKVADLVYINEYPDEDIRKDLIEAGCGNPRLMEDLNTLLQAKKNMDVAALLQKVEGKQEEFVQGLVLREILQSQPEEFRQVMQYSSVFGLSVLREGVHLVCRDLKEWDKFVDIGVQLSLMEENKIGDMRYYWVTPLLREELFGKLSQREEKWCHKAAVAYYRKALSLIEGYSSLYASELIEHALKCDMEETALEEGRTLLSYLRYILAYREALQKGKHILSQLQKLKRDENLAGFLNIFGLILYDVGDSRKAIHCFEQALSINEEIYGEKHPSAAVVLNNLGMALHELGDSRKAIDYYEQALSIHGEEDRCAATTLSNLGSVWRELGDPKKAIDYFEKSLSIYRKLYGEKHPKVAITFNRLGSALRELGDPKKAIDYYEQALSIYKEIYGEKHPNVAVVLNDLGLAWRELGDSRKAIDYFEKSLSIDKEIYGEKHPNVATYLNNLGLILLELGDAKKAIDYFEKSLSIDKEIHGEKHPNVARTLNNLGSALHRLGDAKKAIDYFEKSLSIYRKLYGEKHPKVAITFNRLGSALHELGDPKKAIDYYEQALSISREIYGEMHPHVATALNDLGSALHELGDPKKAIDYYEQALAIYRKLYGEKHPYVATALGNLGSALRELGDSWKAIDYYEQALSIEMKLYGEKHPDVATALNNLGFALYEFGNPKRAIDCFGKSLSINREIYGEMHPSVAIVLNNLGLVLLALGDAKKAIDYFEKSLSIDREIYGEMHPSVATHLINLGRTWGELGNPEKAVECIQKAHDISQEIFGDDHPKTRAAKELLDTLKNV